MENAIVKSSITKLRSADILHAIRRWSIVNEPGQLDLNFKKTKGSIAAQLIEHCKSEDCLSIDTAAELDLISLQLNSAKRQWCTYQLLDKQAPSSKFVSFKTDPAKFKSQLDKLAKLHFNKGCHVFTMLHQGLLWGRVYLPRPGETTYQQSRCLYFVHYPETPILLLMGMKVSYNKFISQCLVVALGYQQVKEMSLSGRHMESLAELAINKYSQGGFTRFQSTQRTGGPLTEITAKRRRAPSGEYHSDIVDENFEEKKQRTDHLDSHFGKFVLPTLEKIEYRVEVPYRGKGVAEELKLDGQNMESSVKFSGTSVLEGLRNLATTGYAGTPLPKHLTCVPSRARNYFLLSKPQKQSDTSRTGDGMNSSVASSRK